MRQLVQDKLKLKTERLTTTADLNKLPGNNGSFLESTVLANSSFKTGSLTLRRGCCFHKDLHFGNGSFCADCFAMGVQALKGFSAGGAQPRFGACGVPGPGACRRSLRLAKPVA